MLSCLARLARLALAALALAALTASCTKPGDAKPEPAPAAQGPALEGRRIDITAGPEGYSPATVEAKSGESLVLRFTRTTKSDCLGQVVFPGLNITKDLPLGTPVEIAVKADKAGKIPFQCGMAMVKGSVNVSGT
jgi:plastocyanin domain-containing protein